MPTRIPIFTDDQIEAIRKRKPFGTTAGNPWVIGYRSPKTSGYIIASSGVSNDDEKPHDLAYIHPGGGIAPLTPMVSPELLDELVIITEGTLL